MDKRIQQAAELFILSLVNQKLILDPNVFAALEDEAVKHGFRLDYNRLRKMRHDEYLRFVPMGMDTTSGE